VADDTKQNSRQLERLSRWASSKPNTWRRLSQSTPTAMGLKEHGLHEVEFVVSDVSIRKAEAVTEELIGHAFSASSVSAITWG
jgi:hypothetical protein